MFASSVRARFVALSAVVVASWCFLLVASCVEADGGNGEGLGSGFELGRSVLALDISFCSGDGWYLKEAAYGFRGIAEGVGAKSACSRARLVGGSMLVWSAQVEGSGVGSFAIPHVILPVGALLVALSWGLFFGMRGCWFS